MILLVSNEVIIIITVIIAIFGVIAFVSYYFAAKQVVLRKLSKASYKSIGGLKPNEFTKVSGGIAC